MVQAVFNGRVIADSDATVVVEGNHYFPGPAAARPPASRGNLLHR